MFSSRDRAALLDHLYRRQAKAGAPAEALTRFVAAAQSLNDAQFVAALVDHALFSPESALLFRDRLIAAQAEPLRQRPDLDIVSLGPDCLTSDLLQGLALKRFSGPLDWLLSSPEMAEHALADDFRTLLDRARLRFIPPDQRANPTTGYNDHLFYKERFGVGGVFAHHDPLNRAEDHDYFQRCAARFLALRESAKRKIFVMMHTQRDDLDRAPVYARIAAFMHASYGGRCVFVDVMPRAAELGVAFTPRRETDTHEIWRAALRGDCHALVFDQPLDAIDLAAGLAALIERRLALL